MSTTGAAETGCCWPGAILAVTEEDTAITTLDQQEGSKKSWWCSCNTYQSEELLLLKVTFWNRHWRNQSTVLMSWISWLTR